MIEKALDALKSKNYAMAIQEFTALIDEAEADKKVFLLWSRLGCHVIKIRSIKIRTS